MNKNEKDKKEKRQNRAEPQADRKARKPAAAEPQEPAEEIRQEPAEVVGVRFKAGGKVYYFDPGELTLQAGEQVIVETVRGLEFGTVAAGNKTVRASEIVGALKPVVRVATEADIRKNEQNKQLEEGAWAVWAENVKKNGLVMQLVDVEYTFDNSKLIFYFTADGRVDFRELVKDLAAHVPHAHRAAADRRARRGEAGRRHRACAAVRSAAQSFLAEFRAGVDQDGQGAEPFPLPRRKSAAPADG